MKKELLQALENGIVDLETGEELYVKLCFDFNNLVLIDFYSEGNFKKTYKISDLGKTWKLGGETYTEIKEQDEKFFMTVLKSGVIRNGNEDTFENVCLTNEQGYQLKGLDTDLLYKLDYYTFDWSIYGEDYESMAKLEREY